MDSDMAADSQDSVQNLAVTREVYGDVLETDQDGQDGWVKRVDNNGLQHVAPTIVFTCFQMFSILQIHSNVPHFVTK